jgi:CobQ-like glutamine amidotransferase family enzyme/UDP-N-acetylmuramyl tripeptide synthase
MGEGSVIGGRVGLLLAPDLLASLAAGRTVALVSGTNGKTTTTHLLAAALGGRERVATSAAGANLPPGLAVALAGSPPGTPAVLEVDEAYLGPVAEATSPRVVTLLNLSRDQLDRVSEVRMVANRWRQALSGLETTVVANADDPLVVWAAGTARKVIWVAAGLLWQGDAVGCPSCEGHIAFAGDTVSGWGCPCGFSRPQPDARLMGDRLLTADGRDLVLHLLLPSRANRANAAMAATAARVLGVDEADALRAMASVTDVEGRFSVVSQGGTRARLLLAKNPAGWTELLDLLEGGTDPVVIGINARIADGHDPSWLWDVDFERLAGRSVVATGDRRRDLAVRLLYAGVGHVTVADQLDALTAAAAGSVEYVGNYTAFQDLRRSLRGARGGEPRSQASPAAAVPPRPAPVPTAATGPSRRPSALRVVVIYPDLLGTYGDAGNGRVLAARAAWRGIPVELVMALSDAALPEGGDIYCVGGGEDGPQVQAAERLAGGALQRAVAGGAGVLAVCAGYQIMGSSFPGPDGRRCAGVGLLDVDTVKGAGRRAVGELLTEPLTSSLTEIWSPSEIPSPPSDDTSHSGARPPVPTVAGLGRLTGFENHSGVTTLGPSARPLATVLAGTGNGRTSRTDGAFAGRVVGTYQHGPVLARNPRLADMLLTAVTGESMATLDDEEEDALHDERLRSVSGPAPTVSFGAAWRRLVRVRRA